MSGAVKTIAWWNDEPQLSPVDGGKWKLTRDWEFFTYDAGRVSVQRHAVPQGYETDLASIPRFFRRFCGCPCDETHRNASLVHDWLYTVGGGAEERRGADWIYYKTIRRAGRTRFKAAAEYVALRLCGWRHFNYKKQRTQTEE